MEDSASMHLHAVLSLQFGRSENVIVHRFEVLHGSVSSLITACALRQRMAHCVTNGISLYHFHHHEACDQAHQGWI